MINPAIIPLLAPLRKHKWSDSAMLAIYLQLLILADKDGCAFTSRRELSTLTGISQRKVWSTIRVLARCGLLTAECTAKGSIIKLCDTVSCRLQTKENEPQGVPLANQYPHRLQRIATDCNSKNYKTDQDHNDPPDAPLYKEKEKTERKEAKERKINKKKNFDFERERGAREEFLKEFFDQSRQAELEALCMKFDIDMAELRDIAEQIVAEWNAASLPAHNSEAEARLHLVSVARKRVAERKRNQLINNHITDHENRHYKRWDPDEERRARQEEFRIHILNQLNAPDDDDSEIFKHF